MKFRKTKLTREDRGSISLDKLDTARINDYCAELRIGQHQFVYLMLGCWERYGDQFMQEYVKQQDAA